MYKSELVLHPDHPLKDRLFLPVSNSRLVLFRMLFGIIMAVECLGSIFTGRVKETFVDTPFNFPFIGFEWLSFLHGNWMNYYYGVMGLFCLCVALGLYYRASSFLLAVMWTMTYFAEKTHYNNHYYLMLLLSWIMLLMPAHRRLSLDSKMGRVVPSNTCYNWQHLLLVGQIWIMYTFAAIAKLNPDWLQAMPLKLWMHNFKLLPVIGAAFKADSAPWVMAYCGLLFDLLVVPALLWRRTRLAAFIVSVFFHLSNSILFGIGTFPYMAIALCIFFASTGWLEQNVFRSKSGISNELPIIPLARQKLVLRLCSIYLVIQMLLPIRHWFIKGNVNWTEEGHRMAWRMMLRSKSGGIIYTIRDKNSGREWQDFPNEQLPQEQFTDLTTHPDIIWQYAQYLKKKYLAMGVDPEVYAKGCCILNGKSCVSLIDPKADLAAATWNRFAHNKWITQAY